jgi:hypothetical protein
MSEKGSWLGTITKYVILPVGVLGVGYLLLSNWLTGEKALDNLRKTMEKVLADYMVEYEDFYQKGYLTAEEESVLEAKLKIIENASGDIGKAIANPTEIATTIAAIVGGAIFGAYVLKNGKVVGQSFRDFYSKLKGNTEASLKAQTGVPGVQYTYFNSQELAILARLSSACYMADIGSISTASQMLTGTQAAYNSVFLPQMQTAFNVFSAQLPILSGMQLALVQYQMAELTVFTQLYAFTRPPVFALPVIPL